MQEPFTIDEQIAELRREAGFRPKVYGRFIADGRMTQAQCDERIGRLAAAIDTLVRLRDEDKERREPRLL